MPQSPIAVQAIPGVNKSALNISAPTVVKAAPGVAISVSILVPGTTSGTINDCVTTGAAADANRIAVLPEGQVGAVSINFSCRAGIVVVPGNNQVLAVTFQ